MAVCRYGGLDDATSKQRFQRLVMCIEGPKEPKHMDAFLVPLTASLLKFAPPPPQWTKPNPAQEFPRDVQASLPDDINPGVSGVTCSSFGSLVCWHAPSLRYRVIPSAFCRGGMPYGCEQPAKEFPNSALVSEEEDDKTLQSDNTLLTGVAAAVLPVAANGHGVTVSPRTGS
jgi:hypothetical protein